jgi:ketosteroid isomerase-like protein
MAAEPGADLTTASQRRAEAIYAEYARGNRAYALDALSPDVTWTSHAGPELPWAGTFRGRAAVEAYFARLDALVQITSYEIERIIAQGEWVVALARGTGRFHATGEALTIAKADALRIVDGQVVEFREYYDAAPLVACVARCGGTPG